MRRAGTDTSLHTLHPGDVVCADRGDRIETLLGSCVAILLTDPRRTVGAMCHFVHASGPARGERSGDSSYGNVALETMRRLLRARGIEAWLCEAYLVGGGNMFPHLYGSQHVGDRNVRWTMAELARAGVRILDYDVGGSGYRRVSWIVGPGTPRVDIVSPEEAGSFE
jgi:chemotaxis protein CheD